MEKIIKTKEVLTTEAEAKVTHFLQEIRQNHTLVGTTQESQLYIAYYQPHNYRLYFDFSRENFNPQTTLLDSAKRGMLNTPFTYQISNRTEFIFKFEKCCTIRVKRSMIEIINMIEHKRYYPIEWNDKIYDQIMMITEKKDNECIKILKDFLSVFGGVSRLEIKNRYVQEHKLADESAIAQMPLPMKFYTDIVKKEYNEPNIEFKTSVQAATYAETRAIERIAPAIKHDLDKISLVLENKLTPIVEKLTEQIVLHLKVEQETLKVQQETKKYLQTINLKRNPKHKKSWYNSLG